MILFVLLIWDIVDTKGKILSNGKFILELNKYNLYFFNKIKANIN